MIKRTLSAAVLAALASAMLLTTPAAAASGHGDGHGHHQDNGRPATYQLTGDEGGSKFEGIGADTRRGTFYVSEVTGGEIHRGTVGSSRTTQWIAGDGTDGRYTARGITVDDQGRVYIAGGPNGIGTGRPDLWVYSPSGKLLAALRAPGDNVFLNDVWIGPDGAAYFTNSNSPQLFRVAQQHGTWSAKMFADATGTIDVTIAPNVFNLGGIVLSADRSAFIVAQGNVGKLWRFPVRGGQVTEVRTGGADLTNADGLVRQGNKLTVVRNFSKMIATLKVSNDGRSAWLISERATDPDRVLTTAKELRGRILFVDSKFDETVATPPYQVITNPYGK